MADVRRATTADLDVLVALARELHAESPAYRDEPFEPEVMRRWFADRLAVSLLADDSADDSAVFLAEAGGRAVGLLVACVAQRFHCRLRIAAEMLLYVRPTSRGTRAFPQLVAAYKTWAAQQGAAKAYLGVSTGIHPERTVRAYRKLGFTLDGHNVSTDL